MKQRLWCILLLIALCVSIFALPAAASESDSDEAAGLPSVISEAETEGLVYASGSCYVSETVATLEHNLGYIPDMFIVYIGQVPDNGKLFYAIGFSDAMLAAFDTKTWSTVHVVGISGSYNMATDIGFEHNMENGDKYGFIRNVKENTLTIGGSSIPLATTGFTVSSSQEAAVYKWIAISGIVDYEGGAAPTHSYSSVIIPPTCEEEGKTIHTCSDCGYVYYDDLISPLGHTYEEGVCIRCGDAETTVEHSFASTVIPPTCTEDGMTSHVCSECEYVYYDELTPALGHSYADGVCSVCGASESQTPEQNEPDSVIPDETATPGTTPDEPSGGDGTLVPGGVHAAPIDVEKDSAPLIAFKLIVLFAGLPILFYLAIEPKDSQRRRRRRK